MEMEPSRSIMIKIKVRINKCIQEVSRWAKKTEKENIQEDSLYIKGNGKMIKNVGKANTVM